MKNRSMFHGMYNFHQNPNSGDGSMTGAGGMLSQVGKYEEKQILIFNLKLTEYTIPCQRNVTTNLRLKTSININQQLH